MSVKAQIIGAASRWSAVNDKRHSLDCPSKTLQHEPLFFFQSEFGTSQKPFFVPRKKKDHFSSHSFWRDRVCSVIEARSSGARGGKSMLSALRRRPGRIV